MTKRWWALWLLGGLAAQVAVWWVAAARLPFPDALAVAAIGALGVNLFFNLPCVSLFILVLYEDRGKASFAEIVRLAGQRILLGALLELPVIALVAASQPQEVINGTLFIISLMPLFLQGVIAVFRGVRMVVEGR